MNVTRHNFKECFADLKADIERASCRFIAIDTEFTGLSPTEDEKERYIDTLEERYKKVKRAGESFLITQFGLSTVHLDETQQFVVKTWELLRVPSPYGSVDERFLCQASSLQFLSEHGFDFNKFIGDGHPVHQPRAHRDHAPATGAPASRTFRSPTSSSRCPLTDRRSMTTCWRSLASGWTVVTRAKAVDCSCRRATRSTRC
ncbi:hypothetical protein PINS_up023344 [Pythium insidiosum]|nr:hypothetical protein PINS_up023344 [Pythium insidiosum]